MAAGTEELVAWLEDLLRAGLAGTVRDLATLRHAHADWPTRLLGRLGELYLLARAFLNLHQLGPDARADVLLQVGVTLKNEDLLATAAPIVDAWHVLGQFRWEEDRLTARQPWLREWPSPTASS